MAPSKISFPRGMTRADRGTKASMVLIIVLICVALLSVLILSFLIGARTESASSKQYLTSSEVQNLASSALNFAMAQVAVGAAATNNAISWASQPGMIRNYGTSGTNATALYKLYSSGTMTITGSAAASFTPGAEIDPLWDTKPALYTDLNAPATYLANTNGTTTSTLLFPIVDPRAMAGTNAVAGFSYTSSVNGSTMDGVTNAASATDTTARLPMPVQWLYVLQNGDIIAPDSTSTSTATFANSSIKPAATNSIIGRIAFWTDDESSKVNINTASEGCFWDIPMADLTNEGPLNLYTPASGEYQRYSGHPAQTSLSTVFPWLKGSTPGHTDDLFILMNPRTVTQNIPSGCTGGSLEGTTWYTNTNNALPVKADRMYDSVDELMFDNNRGLLSTNSFFSSFVTTNGTGVTLAPSDIENRRFFLTAHSRAPELTLFNTPRVAIWPLYSSTNGWTASEQLIAKAATIGSTGNQYYFTRSLPLDPNQSDFYDNLTEPTNPNRPSGRNPALLGYLQSMTTNNIPGYGASLSSKWGTDRDQILVEIYDYIRSCVNLRTHVLNGAVVQPTSSGTYTAGTISYTLDVNGAAEVYPTVLSAGTALGSGNSLSVNARGFGRFPVVKEVSVAFCSYQDPVMTNSAPGWNLLPLTMTNAPYVMATNTGTAQAPVLTPNPQIMYPEIIIEMFLPSQGLKQWIPNVRATVSGLSSFQWQLVNSSGALQSTPMFGLTSQKVFNAVNNPQGLLQVSNGYLGDLMLYSDTFNGNSDTADPSYLNSSSSYAKNSNYAPYFYFNGGTATITLDLAQPASSTQSAATYSGSPSVMPSSMRQTYTITFPAIPNPLPNPREAWRDTGTPVSSATGYPTIASRLSAGLPPVITYNDSYAFPFTTAYTSTYNQGSITTNNGVVTTNSTWYATFPDVVKSMVVKHGDYRLVAASSGTITGGVGCSASNLLGNSGNTFVPHEFYFNALPAAAGTTASNPVAAYPTYFQRPSTNPADINYFDADNLHSAPNKTDYPQWQPAAGSGYGYSESPGYDQSTNTVQGIGQYVVGTSPLAYPYQGWGGGPDAGPSISPGISATNSLGRQGDWDNGIGSSPDGPFINKPDEGTDYGAQNSYTTNAIYLQDNVWDSTPQTQSSYGPMRQLVSPVAFGSLPTGVNRNEPWQTLLFCPNPAALYSPGSSTPQGNPHPGLDSPPDYTLLDLFWMPVTEPYAISDSFSTAGKINLNYQILPFTYITRKTGMYAILANQEMTAFPESPVSTSTLSLAYKNYYQQNGQYTTSLQTEQSRYAIDPVATLSQFDTRFNSGDIFHSASDICSLFLVPQQPGTTPGNGYTVANMMDTSSSGFWGTHRITGDNMRERPYNAIYPRVTTQSNVYTVYVKAQKLKQVPATISAGATTFTVGTDVIQGEFQASYTFERYINPNDTNLNSNTHPDMTPLGPYYNLRVINQRTLSR